ncbi:Dicarboxylate carrier MatC domain protein [uncultured Sporomusa sp.]|uniref:Dicarboxylate carrier MatC domain protein n=1 Tax=uncultured Sporomusa sp. TaxID=307249 RepID=A0A212LTK6_9FIRM|nr:SLC13 family permease [uncultured Sporomusa sp.]SCM80729.1 Dicarboxylate carrier MatC domain protein [uncultured Sporomusa sp.]
MDISLAAIMSIIALVIVVIISCVNEDLNVGFLSIAFAIIVGGFWGDTVGTKVLGYFPTGLFMILVGVTFLFGIAQTNGTMEKLTAYSVRLCKGNTAIVPLIVFLLTTFIVTIGPGNIAGTALMAPVAMAIATRINMPALLMTLLVVGAANGAAFSPFAPTGIISNGIIAKMAPELGITAEQLSSLAWKIHFNSEVAQGFVNIGGFFVLGGWAWIQKQRGQALDIDELAPKPEPFNKHQILTLLAVFILILLVILPGLPATKGLFSQAMMNILANVGTIAFILAGVLMLTGSGDSKAAIKVIPWGVIMMVCGVTVLIEVMDKAGGLNALVKLIGAISNPTTINGVLGFVTGLLSAYSSSSGVVMPMFLPMVPGLIQEVGGGNPIALISSINIGAHLVDTSPLSTLGALCIACAGEHEDKAKLFRNLLMWGLAMSVVGGIVCYIFFGILGF